MDGQAPLSTRFVGRLTARAEAAAAEADLEGALGAHLEEARRAFPGLTVAEQAFLERLADCYDRAEGPLATLRAPELYLTCAAGTGDARALARLEADYFGDALAALRRIGLAQAVIDN